MYSQAAGNARLEGDQTAELIRLLISSSPGSADSIDPFYIVGFSLGAQAAGYAGNYLKDQGMKLGRITGKDKPKSKFYQTVYINLSVDPIL